MAKSRLLSVALILQVAQVALTQKCYYPNGKEADAAEKPCSKEEGSACCPDKWQCLDNGMCYYPADKIYGRYSCTDKDWNSDGCPSNLCTYDKKAFGAESLTQCSNHDNQWCCNADNIHVKCCQESPEPRPFFDLGEGKAYATVGSNQANQQPILATITGLATGSGGSSPSSSPSSPTSGSQAASASQSVTKDATSAAATSPMTSLETHVSTGSAGVVTLVVTTVLPPSQTASPASSGSSSGGSSKTGLIAGLAVGIPLGLALIGILIWLFRKRSQQKKNAASSSYPESPNPYTNGSTTPDFAGGAKLHKNNHNRLSGDTEKGTGAAFKMNHHGAVGASAVDNNNTAGLSELPGQTVGPGRPVSTIVGKAELDSGAGFAPGSVAHAPHLVGVGGGNGAVPSTQQQQQQQQYDQASTPMMSSWGSAPPGYTPGQNPNSWAPAPQGVAEVDGTSAAVPSSSRPVSEEVNTTQTQTQGGRYIPYRPPPGHGQTQQPAGGLANVPEVAEMSAVRTPP